MTRRRLPGLAQSVPGPSAKHASGYEKNLFCQDCLISSGQRQTFLNSLSMRVAADSSVCLRYPHCSKAALLRSHVCGSVCLTDWRVPDMHILILGAR